MGKKQENLQSQRKKEVEVSSEIPVILLSSWCQPSLVFQLKCQIFKWSVTYAVDINTDIKVYWWANTLSPFC